MKRGSITTELTEIKRIIREYSQRSYAKKLDHLGEMDGFPEAYKLWKLTQKEMTPRKMKIHNEQRE